MGVVLLFVVPMIPAAIIWAVAYLSARKSLTKRAGLFAFSYLVIGLWIGMPALLLGYLWLPGTLLVLALFEIALAKDRK